MRGWVTSKRAKVGQFLASVDSEILANVDGDRVSQGVSSYDRVIARRDGNKAREGDSSYGHTIPTTEGCRMSAAAAAKYLLLM